MPGIFRRVRQSTGAECGCQRRSHQAPPLTEKVQLLDILSREKKVHRIVSLFFYVTTLPVRIFYLFSLYFVIFTLLMVLLNFKYTVVK